jgi:ArsR family transcriptional regulator
MNQPGIAEAVNHQVHTQGKYHHLPCVCELTCALNQSQPKVSRNLAVLRECGLLADRRQGQWVYYRLHPNLPDWVSEVLRTTLNANKHWLTPDSGRLCAMGNRPERAAACC